MPSHFIYPLPKLHHLPASLPVDGAVRLELQNGLPVLRASTAVQRRITVLLHKQQEMALSPEETDELDRYDEIDDYLSFLNRIVRNLIQSHQP
jgi:phosphoglycerate-specific signal transduction histidine kinase